jgi:hypothetical protein
MTFCSDWLLEKPAGRSDWQMPDYPTAGLPTVFISGWQRRILRELKQRED